MLTDFPVVNKKKKVWRKPQKSLRLGGKRQKSMRLYPTLGSNLKGERELDKELNEWGVSGEGTALKPQIETP